MVHTESSYNKDNSCEIKKTLALTVFKLKNIPPGGSEGGLIIDEMSIQQDLQYQKQNNDIIFI